MVSIGSMRQKFIRRVMNNENNSGCNGGDHAPVEILKGCVDAVNEYGIDLTCNRARRYKRNIYQPKCPLERFEIVNASEI